MSETRFFYHSFPRPKGAERAAETLERGLKILAYMKDVGLVLAPEAVQWDASALSTNDEKITVLQRRACFTELGQDELSNHSRTFGPISLEFEIADLRASGAVPVIYSPQGLPDSIASQLATLVVRGAWHTEKVLQALNLLKSVCDPNQAASFLGLPSGTPVSPDCMLHLRNPSPDGGMAAEYDVPAVYVRQVLDHVGYRSIPFDHSAAILRLVMNMFYPTDNDFTGTELGYYGDVAK